MRTCSVHNDVTSTKNMLYTNDCSTCNLNKIVGWLNESKKTLDICMYSFSHKLMYETVMNAYERGVCIRLIVDSDNVYTTWNMGAKGIAKKIKQNPSTENLMHHKFIIIDNNKVILGSSNWTTSAFRNNWENIFISNESKLVVPFQQEFQSLWSTNTL